MALTVNANVATTARALTSKSVRCNDNKGFSRTFNKTNFSCVERQWLYQFFVKCYEQSLRGKAPDTVADRKKFRKFRRFLVYLKPLPAGFQELSDKKKFKVLKKLINELEDKAAEAINLERNQDIDMLVNNSDYIPLDDGRAASDIIHASPHDDSSQNVALTHLGYPEGPPLLNPCEHLYEFRQPECALCNLKRRASRYPDLSARFDAEVEKFNEELMEREFSEPLLDDSNVHLRNRQTEIFEGLEADLLS